MPSLVTDNFRVFAAEQFIESLAEPFTTSGAQETDSSAAAQAYRSKIYLFIGRSQNWTVEKYNGSSATELEPPTPYDSFDEMNEVYDDMIAMKRVTSADVAKVIRRNTWKSGLKYDMYKNDYTPSKLSVNGQSKLYDAQFYVITSAYRVYKCIFNGESPENPTAKVSTVEPTSTGTSIETTSDGYRWLYMYTIDISDYIKFVSSDFMPIKTDATVQAAAAAKSGAIEQIIIKNRGSGIASGTYYCPILGDGSGGIATIVVDSNQKIETATASVIGSGYTRATIKLDEAYGTSTEAVNRANSGRTVLSNAVLETIVSPPNGHGSDMSRELGGYRVMINKSLDFLDGDGDIPVDSQFRRYGLVSDPVVAGGTTDLTDPTVTACNAVIFDTTDKKYTPGEIIFQATTGAKGRVIHWDNISKVLRYYQNEHLDATQTGNGQYKLVPFSGANAIVGQGDSSISIPASGTSLTPKTSHPNNSAASGIASWTSGYATSEVKKQSGTIIYAENRKAVNRSNDQIEDIKLVVEF